MSLADYVSESYLRSLADARGWADGVVLADDVVFETVTADRAVATVNAPDGPARVELTAGDRFGYTCSCTDVPEACRHVVAAGLAASRYRPPA